MQIFLINDAAAYGNAFICCMVLMREGGVTKHQLRFRNQRDLKERAKAKRKRQRERKKSGTTAGFPQTLETLRQPDETILPKTDLDLQWEEENVCYNVMT